MEIYITHDSALQYWRLRGKKRGSLERHQRKTNLPTCSPDKSFLFWAGATGVRGLSLPLDILVATGNTRRPSRMIKPHVFSGSLPENSFVNISDSLFVSSPELCFFQMASRLTLVKLIELGFELCGSYSLPVVDLIRENPEIIGPDDGPGCLYGLPELTNVKKLAAFIERMAGVKGYATASKALHYILNESGSPMETILVMFLILPYKLGGYGLPKPSLNHLVKPIKVAKRSSNKAYFKCDLLWENKRLAVEYDSEEHHAGAHQIVEDAKRRNVLFALGLSPITVTKQQLYSVSETENIAVLLARELGRRLRHKKPDFSKVHNTLRKSLL